MLIIQDMKIYSEDGTYLKTIDCPEKVKNNYLKNINDKDLLCSKCNKNIIDTKFTTENELINILKKDRNTCLKISRFNPMFRFE